MDKLIKILEASVAKNGEIHLTNKHLLNILKLVRKNKEREYVYYEEFEADINS